MKRLKQKSTFNNGTGMFGTITQKELFVTPPAFRFNNQPAIDLLHRVTEQHVSRIYFTPVTDHGLRIFKVKITMPSGVKHTTDLLICRSTYEYARQFLDGWRPNVKPILTGEEDYWAFKDEDFGFLMLQMEYNAGDKLIVDYERTRKSNGYYIHGYTDHAAGYMLYRIRWTKEVDDYLNENNLIQRQYLQGIEGKF